MSWIGWVLVGWLVVALLGSAFCAWVGWHLNRSRHERYLGWQARNRPTDDTPEPIPPRVLPRG